jgi:PBSX family phage terminase large subunit
VPFAYTDKQKKGLALINDKSKSEILLDGGSRSGKTILIARYYILKSARYPGTRRLVCRKSKSSCIASVWDQTLITLLNTEFKGVGVEVGRGSSSHRIQFVNGSSIWAGGFDNSQHMDAILGQEWADIWPNEATDITYEDYGRLKTRLNWDPKLSPVSLKMILDCNPRNPGHWLHRRFIEGVDTSTREPLPEDERSRIGRMWFHPLDNAANLSPAYVQSLQALTGMNFKRFWEGIWCDNFQGQVFRFDRAVNHIDTPIAYNPNLETWCSWDFGVSPSETFIIWYQIVPFANGKCIVNIIDEMVDHDKPAEHYINAVNARPYKRDMFDAVDPAGNARDAKLESWVSLMRQAGRQVRYVTNFRPHEMIDNANAVMPYIRVCDKQCPRTVECLENWSYPTDKDGKVQAGALPNHDEYSHGGTSFYYFTTNRFNPKRAIVS